MVVSTVSAAFAPAVPPHSGCFIQKTWTSSPCLTPVCFHSASVSKLLPTSYGGAAEIQRKPMWTVLTLMCLFLCLSPLFFFMSFFFSTGMSEGGLYFEAVFYWCQACDVLYKMRICCSKLPGEFTREPCVKRKALFSYPVGPNSCFVVLICGTEGPEALFNGLAAFFIQSVLQRPYRATSSSHQRKVANIHRFSRVGKAPNEATSHGCKQLPLLLY